MTTPKLSERQPRVGLKLQMELSALGSSARAVTEILYRRRAQSRKGRTMRPLEVADVPALMDDLFPRRPRHPMMPATAPDDRGDVVHGLACATIRLVADRWYLLSPERRRRLALARYPYRWWADSDRRYSDDHDPIAYAIWVRVQRGRASLKDARTIASAGAAIVRICAEVIAMHYDAASDPPRELSTWKPWKTHTSSNTITAPHESR